jgi:4-deoxy-L-threo-5-hexosulose-uronate ketol-isomerase
MVAGWPDKPKNMQVRFTQSPQETAAMQTQALRDHFLISNLFEDNKINLTYTHYDRVIVGGVKPVKEAVELPNPAELRAEFFLERREIGIINVGGNGKVIADGTSHAIAKMDCVYLGKGTESVSFVSEDANNPALFYLLSAPAHHTYPAAICKKQDAQPVELGATSTSNKRTVYKYIHLEGIKSCQLVMGLTVLEDGSVWNSVPPHTHTRRMEVYFYFDLAAEHRVFHFMGEPSATKHIVIANHEATISAPWSTHFGCGTSNYGFIWGMAGENLVYTDMDPAPIHTLA